MAEYLERDVILKAFKLIAKNSDKRYEKGMQDTIDWLIPRVIADIPAAEVQPVDRWISVDDRVPDISGMYLCYLATGEMEVQEFCREINDDEYNNNYPFGCWVTYPSDDGGECREWIEMLEITHWQFLPKPPKQ